MGSNTYAYTYDLNHPHAVKAISYTGTSPLDMGPRTISYNTDQMPIRIEQVKTGNAIIVDYLYDGTSTRVKKAVQGGAITYYVGEHFEVINGVETKYIFAGNLRIAKKTQQGRYYFHKDHLGSSTAMTDASGAKVETTEYVPYGEMRDHTGTEVTNYKFTDQELDPETGLYNYGARLYDPVIGRFINPDTIIPDVYDPQMLNRYSYCRNNPLIYVDPTGHLPDGGYGSYGKTGNIDGDKGKSAKGSGLRDALNSLRDFLGGLLGIKGNPNTGTIKDPWATRSDLKAPVDPKLDVTSHFGLRIPPTYKQQMIREYGKIPNFERDEEGNLPMKPHGGVDLAALRGTAIVAPGDGVVTQVNPDPNTLGGKSVTITSDTAIGKVDTTVMHCNEVNVYRGEEVTRGEKVGTTGNTGLSTTGAHAHVSTTVNGRKVNPKDVYSDYDKSRRP